MKEQNWIEEGWFYHNHAWHLLHEIIKQIPDKIKNLLDVGAGTGIAASIIKAIYPGITIRVCDIEESSKKFWEKRKINGDILNSEYLPYNDNAYDFVMSSHVIEHLKDPKDLIKEMFRVSRGRIVIVVPDGDVHFYDHKIIYNRTILKNTIFEALEGKCFKFKSFPLYHSHINNLIAVIKV